MSQTVELACGCAGEADGRAHCPRLLVERGSVGCRRRCPDIHWSPRPAGNRADLPELSSTSRLFAAETIDLYMWNIILIEPDAEEVVAPCIEQARARRQCQFAKPPA